MGLKKYLQRQLSVTGNDIPMMPDGPRLERFSAVELAQAIDGEINRAASVGHAKIRIDLDLHEAAALASFLRRAHVLGA